MEPLALVALLIGGLVAGIINSVAGGGSLITLPLLVFVGLPPTVANATNRLAVAVQSLAAVAGFDGWGTRRRRSEQSSEKAYGEPSSGSRLPWDVVARTFAPAVLGSLAGAMVASRVSDEAFRPLLGAVLVVMGVILVIRPNRWLVQPEAPRRSIGTGLLLAFFAAGFYGGFVQAGVGFLLLFALVPGLGLDLVRANGVKVALVLILTLVALAVFVAAGQVDWRAGGTLAVGNGAGGYIGARLAVGLGAGPIRWIVFVMVVLFALELLGARELLFSRL